MSSIAGGRPWRERFAEDLPGAEFSISVGVGTARKEGSDSLNSISSVNGAPADLVARRDPAQQYDQQYQDGQQYGAVGEPVQLTPQPQLLPGRRIAPQVQTDDGYIYPADGSATDQRYPAPRRRLYDAQANPQQYYNNPGYAGQPAPPQGYYQQQQRQYYQPRGLFD